MSEFRPPEHIFDRGDAVENYTAWRDAEIERRLNDQADEYYPFKPANFREAVNEALAESGYFLNMIEKGDPIIVGGFVRQCVVMYWRDALVLKYDEKSGVM